MPSAVTPGKLSLLVLSPPSSPHNPVYSVGPFAPISFCRVRFTLKKKNPTQILHLSSVTVLMSEDFQHKSKGLMILTSLFKKRTTIVGQTGSDQQSV